MKSCSFEPLELRRLMSVAVADALAAAPVAPPSAVTATTTPILQGTSVAIHATLNHPFSGVVGTFNHFTPPVGHHLMVTIYWGDDVASSGVIHFANGGATISGQHTWHIAGDYLVRAYVYASPFVLTSSGLATGIPIARVQSIADVQGGNAVGTIFKPVRNKLFNGHIGSFTTHLDLSKYNVKVSINWGDGGSTPSAGSIAMSSTGHYTVNGQHTYTRLGIFEVKVTVTAALKGSPTATPVVLVAALNSLAQVIAPTPTTA